MAMAHLGYLEHYGAELRPSRFADLCPALQQLWLTDFVNNSTDRHFWHHASVFFVRNIRSSSLHSAIVTGADGVDAALLRLRGYILQQPRLIEAFTALTTLGSASDRRLQTAKLLLLTCDGLDISTLLPVQHTISAFSGGSISALVVLHPHRFRCSVCLTVFLTLDNLREHCKLQHRHVFLENCLQCQAYKDALKAGAIDQADAEIWQHTYDCHYGVYHALHLAELEVSRSYDAVKLQRSVVAARQAPDDQMTLAVGQWRLQPGHAQRLSSVVLPYHCLKCSVLCKTLTDVQRHLPLCGLSSGCLSLIYAKDLVMANPVLFCCQFCHVGFRTQDNLLLHFMAHLHAFQPTAAMLQLCHQCQHTRINELEGVVLLRAMQHLYDHHYDAFRTFHASLDIDADYLPDAVALNTVQARPKVVVTQWRSRQAHTAYTSVSLPLHCSACTMQDAAKHVVYFTRQAALAHLISAEHLECALEPGAFPMLAVYGSESNDPTNIYDREMPFEVPSDVRTVGFSGGDRIAAELEPGTWLKDSNGEHWYRLRSAIAESQGLPSPILDGSACFNRAYRGFDPDVVATPPVTEGLCTDQCQHCGAYRWRNEPVGSCCKNGATKLPLAPPPSPLAELFAGENSAATNRFREGSHRINQAVAVGHSSITANVLAGHGAPSTIRTQGVGNTIIPSVPDPASFGPDRPAFKYQSQFLQKVAGGAHGEDHLRLLQPGERDTAKDILHCLKRLWNPVYVQAQAAIDIVEEWQATNVSLVPIRVEVRHEDGTPVFTRNGSGALVVTADHGDPGGAVITPLVDGISIPQCDDALPLRYVEAEAGSDLNFNDWPYLFNGPEDLSLCFTPAFGGYHVTFDNPAFLAVTFPVLNAYGWPSWNRNMRLFDVRQKRFTQRDLSARDYYAHLQFRREPLGAPWKNPWNFGGMVSKHARCTILSHILWQQSEGYTRAMQRLAGKRKVLCSTARAAVEEGASVRNKGRSVMAPQVRGSTEFLKKAKQDAITNALQVAPPSAFITFTFNAKDEDMRAESDGRQSHHMDAEVVRLSDLKFQRLIRELKNGHFGKLAALAANVEWQGRDLPHLHILPCLDLLDPETLLTEIKMARASIAHMPNPFKDPELAAVIFKCNIHTCMERCLRPYGCRYGFPYAYRDGFELDESQHYPLVERMPPRGNLKTDRACVHFIGCDGTVDSHCFSVYENGAVVLHTDKGDVDARNVVKYNPDLSRRYRCHINFEFIAKQGRANVYVFKYMTKGDKDVTATVVQEEVGKYGQPIQRLEGIVLNTHQALLHLLGKKMVFQYPSIKRLPVHLPGQDEVLVESDATVEDLEELLQNKGVSELLGYFEYNRDAPFVASAGSTLLAHVPYGGTVTCPCDDNEDRRIRSELWMPSYEAFGSKMRWNASKAEWTIYKRTTESLARMHLGSYSDKERFSLRLLLGHVPAPTCYNDLLSKSDGTFHATFQLAAEAHCLLRNDNAWKTTFLEMIARGFGWYRSCADLVLLLINDELTDPLGFFRHFQASLSPSPLRQGLDQALAKSVRRLADLLRHESKTLADVGLAELEPLLPVTGTVLYHDDDGTPVDDPLLLTDPIAYLHALPDVGLTAEQQNVLNEVSALVSPDALLSRTINGCETKVSLTAYNNRRCMFLDGPGGTGKTTLLKQILKSVLLQHGTVATVTASTGIAASLLPSGRTVHSTFKVPLEFTAQTVYSTMEALSSAADVLRRAPLLILDEVSMMSYEQVRVVDYTYRDLCNDRRPFGGKVVVLAGDFRQCAPVVKDVSPRKAALHSLKLSNYWPLFEPNTFRLTCNLRVRDPQHHNWAEWILRVGNGTVPTAPASDSSDRPLLDLTTSPLNMDLLLDDSYVGEDVELGMIAWAFPALAQGTVDQSELQTTTILSSRHLHVNSFNERCTSLFPGQAQTFTAYDSELPASLTAHDKLLLEGFCAKELPAKVLNLKVGMPVMIIRNLKAGLSNGTRCVVTHLGGNFVGARVTTGPQAGKEVHVPRICFKVQHPATGMVLKRWQLPLTHGFALTVHKCQGQTLEKCLLDLRSPCFAHGQLYVALSRCSDPTLLKVFLPESAHGCTPLAFEAELLQGLM